MKPSYLIDTVILIDHLNGRTQATKWLSRIPENSAAISVVTMAEVLVGTQPSEEAAIRLLLESYTCLPLTPEIAVSAAQLRRQHRWKLPDAFQAAIALHHRLKLVTRNTKDFNPSTHSFVTIPY